MLDRARDLLLATAVAMLAACGGGDDADSAPAACEAIFDLACERIAECGVGGLTEDQCNAQFETQVDCDAADQVGATYDSCMDMLDTLGCDQLFPGGQVALPADCMGVIIFE